MKEESFAFRLPSPVTNSLPPSSLRAKSKSSKFASEHQVDSKRAKLATLDSSVPGLGEEEAPELVMALIAAIGRVS
jgi:hypothetical protein